MVVVRLLVDTLSTHALAHRTRCGHVQRAIHIQYIIEYQLKPTGGTRRLTGDGRRASVVRMSTTAHRQGTGQRFLSLHLVWGGATSGEKGRVRVPPPRKYPSESECQIMTTKTSVLRTVTGPVSIASSVDFRSVSAEAQLRFDSMISVMLPPLQTARFPGGGPIPTSSLVRPAL